MDDLIIGTHTYMVKGRSYTRTYVMHDSYKCDDMQFVKFYAYDAAPWTGAVYNMGMAVRTPNGYTENPDGSGPYYADPMEYIRIVRNLR